MSFDDRHIININKALELKILVMRKIKYYFFVCNGVRKENNPAYLPKPSLGRRVE